jgi:hypothetical protein
MIVSTGRSNIVTTRRFERDVVYHNGAWGVREGVAETGPAPRLNRVQLSPGSRPAKMPLHAPGSHSHIVAPAPRGPQSIQLLIPS